ncbi:hypothetical protein PybrP1_002367 [[Pythium] brassicae (nom. inval.)]|nr:hypothetical protein PybrP1_002367 [[Pythium] brassicae (nom. inval.)]
MDVLSSKPISDRDAAKLLRKFVAAKENEDNGDLVMTDEVAYQLAQVLEHLEGKKPQAAAAKAQQHDEEEAEDDE